MADTRSARVLEARVDRFVLSEGNFRWSETDVLEYKPAGTHFKDITRQILFDEELGLPTQLRYFEIGEGGHSTLERHQHVHAVVVLRGRGQVLLGDRVEEVRAFDTVYVPPGTWHQFRANRAVGLGFLCLVACDRDRPERPSEEQLRGLRSNPIIADFIRY